MPGNEDANLMAVVISFFVLLGTIGYWMFLRSKAAELEAEKRKARAEVGLPATATDAELEQRKTELEACAKACAKARADRGACVCLRGCEYPVYVCRIKCIIHG